MKTLKPVEDILHFLGFNTRQQKYAYGLDPEFGYVSASRVADTWVETTCGYCSVGCGMLIGVKDGKAVSARGNPEHPVNMGKLCPKGLSEHHILSAPGRATEPLLRKNGVLTPVSWDEALTVMVERFTSIQARHGKRALGVISTGQLVTEEFYTLGKLVQLGFGTNNLDGNTTLCMATAVSGYKLSFGSDGPPGSYADLDTADVILLIGANIADNHPILCQRLERNRQTTLIVADPRVTKTAMMADIHLALKPRSDVALLNGIAHILIRDGLIDRAYIDAHTTGFEALAALVAMSTPAVTAAATGLSEAAIERVAGLYGRAKAGFIGWTMGVNQSTQGSYTVAAINNLALLTGNIGRAGASPFSITGQCNAMGTRETGFASSMPGYRTWGDLAAREDLARLWNVEPERIPLTRGYAYPDMIEAAVRREVRALWIIGTNPAVSFPNNDLLTHALNELEFVVVSDGFHTTPTTEFADLVLPAAIWGEKDGTFTNSERRVSKANKVVEPPELAKSDFHICLAVAEKLGKKDELYPGWTTAEDAYKEWQRVSKGRLCDYSPFGWDQIQADGGVQWGGERLYADGVFPTPDGRAIFHAVAPQGMPEPVNEEFPFILNTGRTVEHWHTRTKTGAVPMLQHMSPRAWLEMNPVDAQRLGLHSHDTVKIASRRSTVEGVELRVTGIIGPGQVFMPFHFAETNANLVTLDAFDPISRQPNFKQCAVRVEKSALR